MNEQVLNGVKDVLVKTLSIQDRAGDLSESTPLFGSMPELDSLAVVELAAALEERFHFQIDDSEFTADIFDTVGTLAQFVDERVEGSVSR